MNPRRLFQMVAAGLLAVGLLTTGSAPANALPSDPSRISLSDTGWG